MPPEEARDAAKKWTLGRGRDFLEAGARWYADVFGDDVAPYLYTTIGEEEGRMWKRIHAATIYSCMLTLFPRRTWSIFYQFPFFSANDDAFLGRPDLGR